MHIIDDLLSIVAPFDCCGCGAEGSLLCQLCRIGLPSAPTLPILLGLRNLWAACHYSGLPEELIKSLKFGRAQAAAGLIAQIMAENLPDLPVDCLVVPLPTASRRVRQRGYDQAELIAKHLAGNLGLASKRLLRRQTQTRQLGANRQQRHQQLVGAFQVKSDPALFGRPILLIDDVMTTGATIEAAAASLSSVGYSQLSAAVFAYKP